MGRKHCGKSRKCWLPAFSTFLKMFSKGFLYRVVKSRDCVVKQLNEISDISAVTPSPGGSVVSVLDSWPGGCEFDSRFRQTSFPAFFHLSPLQKHVRKVIGGFEKESCVSTGVRKPGNICVTDRHDMTLAVKVALNPNTTNQSAVTHFKSFPSGVYLLPNLRNIPSRILQDSWNWKVTISDWPNHLIREADTDGKAFLRSQMGLQT